MDRNEMFAQVKSHFAAAEAELVAVCALLAESDATQDVKLGLVVADLPVSFCRGAVAGIEEAERRGYLDD